MRRLKSAGCWPERGSGGSLWPEEMYENIDTETNEITFEYQPKVDEKIIRFVALTNTNGFPISKENIKDRYGIVSYKSNKLLEN